MASNVMVQFPAVAATSQILIYVNKKNGSCLWGVFVQDPTAPRATLVISYGANITTAPDGGIGDCVPNPLFADIQPGDQLSITGKTSPYAPSTCVADGYPAPATQMQVLVNMKDTDCLHETGSGPAPTPTKVTDLSGLSTGKLDYQGLLVELNDVDATPLPDGGTVGPMGVVTVGNANGSLEIHDKFYFKAQGAPQFPGGMHFTKIVGLSYLDYCTWSLQPLNKCTDFDPKSTDCP